MASWSFLGFPGASWGFLKAGSSDQQMVRPCNRGGHVACEQLTDRLTDWLNCGFVFSGCALCSWNDDDDAFGTIWAIWGLMGPSGPYGTIWSHMGPYQAIWGHMGPSRATIWAQIMMMMMIMK